MAKTTHGPENWDFTKFWGDFSLPQMNVDAFAAVQQRNMEAFAAANRLAADGFQAVARRQAELMRDAFETGTRVARTYAETTSPAERLQHHAELSREAFETGMTNARELGGMMTESTDRAVRVMVDRVTEGLDEMADIVTGDAAPKKPASNGKNQE